MAFASRRWLRRLPLLIFVVLLLLFLFLPLVLVVLTSLNSTPRIGFPIEGLSWRWYGEALHDETYSAAIRTSAVTALAAAGLTTIFGTLAALATASPSRLRASLTALFLMPMALPGLFSALSLLVFFSKAGVPLSRQTVIAAQLLYTFPYFFLIVRFALERRDPYLAEVAADLGANPLQRFARVTLPMIAPVLISAAVLSFALAFDEFIRTFFVIGPESTIPLVLWSQFRVAIDPSVNAIASLLLAVTSLGVIVAFTLVFGRTALRHRFRRGKIAPADA
jgi:spermidine/putrescine transport system permease protein